MRASASSSRRPARGSRNFASRTSDHALHHHALGQVRDLAVVRHVERQVPGTVVHARQRHAPALPPARLLGEEAGDELHQVAVTRSGQDPVALEQLQLDLVGVQQQPE
jgi:hypothetical protein